METILGIKVDGSAKAATQATEVVAVAEDTMRVATAIIILVGLGLIWVIPRSVIAPVQESVALAHSIADGDLQRRDCTRLESRGLRG